MATATATFPRARRRSQLVGATRRSFPDVYFVKRIDNSRLRREVNQEKRRECFGLLGLGILVFLFGLLFTWQHFQCVRYGYQIEQLKSQRAALEEWNHQLRLEQASLADPQRIDRLARRELGLAPPSPQRVIPMGPGGENLDGNSESARDFSSPHPSLGESPRGQ